MRDLKQSDHNKMILEDPISGSKITLYYRLPTSTDRVEFEAASYRREGTEVIDNTPQARVDSALKILTGFSEGSFGYGGEPISADPASPHYREDWKDLVRETASDLLSALSLKVFMGLRVVPDEGANRGEGKYIIPFDRK